jgi:hypothetical protein
MWRGALIAGGLLLAGSATAALVPAGSNAVTGAGRVSHASAGPQCAAGSPMNALEPPAIRTLGTPKRQWRAPAPLVPAGTATGSLGLAATAVGLVLAGWVQGPPPIVSAGGPGRSSLRNSRAITLAKASTQEVSVNSRGELIAAWVHDDGASSPRTSPGSARFVPAKLIVALCRPALQCGSPETIRLGTTKPACINPAVAISPQGAATVIAAAADLGHRPRQAARGLGLRDSGRSRQPSTDAGDSNEGRLADRRTGRSDRHGDGVQLRARLIRFVLVIVPACDWRRTLPDVAARPRRLLEHRSAAVGASYQRLVRHHLVPRKPPCQPDISLNAVVGHDGQLQRSSVAVGATQHISAYLGATDAHGNAMILFNGSTDAGDGAAWPYTRGLYTTVRRA